MTNYPLPYWWAYTVSPPVDGGFYYDVETQEERLKKICANLWKLILLYKMVVDAINDHEVRIVALETKIAAIEAAIANLLTLYNNLLTQINSINTQLTTINGRLTTIDGKIVTIDGHLVTIDGRLTTIDGHLVTIDNNMVNLQNKDINLQNQINSITTRIDTLITDLPTLVQTIVDSYLNSAAFVTKVTDIVNTLIANKMNKVLTATENDIATFDALGNVKDGNRSITIINPIVSSNDVTIPTSKAVYGAIMSHNHDFVISDTPINALAASVANPTALVYIVEV